MSFVTYRLAPIARSTHWFQSLKGIHVVCDAMAMAMAMAMVVSIPERDSCRL